MMIFWVFPGLGVLFVLCLFCFLLVCVWMIGLELCGSFGAWFDWLVLWKAFVMLRSCCIRVIWGLFVIDFGIDLCI